MQAIDSVISIVAEPIKWVTQVKGDSDTLRKTAQIAIYTFTIFTPTFPIEKLEVFVKYIDCIDVFWVASYFGERKKTENGEENIQETELKKDWRQKKVCKLISSVLFSVGLVTGSALFLQEIGVTAIGTAAAKIGSLPVFGIVASGISAIGLTTLLLSTFAAAYFFSGLNALQKLCSSESSTRDKVLNSLDLVSYMSDAAFLAALAFPVAGIPILGLGFIAKGTAIVKFLIKENPKENSFIIKSDEPKVVGGNA